MTSIFEASLVTVISRGVGDILLWGDKNIREVKCRLCKNVILPGRGYRFEAARAALFSTGYVCPDCVGNTLRTSDWTYSTFTGNLISASYSTFAPFPPVVISGAILAQAWCDHGTEGIRISAISANKDCLVDLARNVNVSSPPE